MLLEALNDNVQVEGGVGSWKVRLEEDHVAVVM
jgi:hypothetical protein